MARSGAVLIAVAVFLTIYALPAHSHIQGTITNDHSHKTHDHGHNHNHNHNHNHDHDHGHNHDKHGHHHHHEPHPLLEPVLAHLRTLLHPLTTLPPHKAALTAATIASSTTLVSLLLLPLPLLTPYLLPFAAGALLTDLFSHLLPHRYQSAESPLNSLLFGITIFAIFDTVLRRFTHNHSHTHTPEKQQSPARMHVSAAVLNLLADALHNFCDGITITAAFATSSTIGIATTLATVLHELPQELADYSILVQAGMSHRLAVFLNLLVATTTILGAYMAQKVVMDVNQHWMTGIAGGGLLYMTLAQVIPEIVADVASVKGVRFLWRVASALAAAMAGVWLVGLVESLHEH